MKKIIVAIAFSLFAMMSAQAQNMATVSTQAALKAYSLSGLSAGFPITETGVNSAGDAPPVVYTLSTSPCTLNSHMGDGGSQLPSSTSGNCWILSPGQTTDARTFGAVPGATQLDQSSYINNWLTWLGSTGNAGTSQSLIDANFNGQLYVVNSPLIPAANERLDNGEIIATSNTNFNATNGMITITAGFNITIASGFVIDCGGLASGGGVSTTVTGINGVYNTQEGNIVFSGQIYHWVNTGTPVTNGSVSVTAGNGIYNAGKMVFDKPVVEQWKSTDQGAGDATADNSGYAAVEAAIGDSYYLGGNYQGGWSPFLIKNGSGVIRFDGVHAWTAWANSTPVLNDSVDYQIYGNHVTITGCYADSGEIDDYVTSTSGNPGLTVEGCVGLPTTAVTLRAWVVLIATVPNANIGAFNLGPNNQFGSGYPYMMLTTSGTGSSWNQLQGPTAQLWLGNGGNSQWDDGGIYFFETGTSQANIARFAGSGTGAYVQFADGTTSGANGPSAGALGNNLVLEPAGGGANSAVTLSTNGLVVAKSVTVGGNGVFGSPLASSITSSTGTALSSGELVNGSGSIILRSGPTANFTDTTSTATSEVGVINGAIVGTGWPVTIVNNSAFTETLGMGSGMTAVGTMTIAAHAKRDFLFSITNVSTPAITVTTTDPN